MARHSRAKNGVAPLACVPAIHVIMASKKGHGSPPEREQPVPPAP
jgi:hypothetical protein